MSFGHTLYPLMLGQGGHTRVLGLKPSVSCSPLGYKGNARGLERLK
jgi:hypothetical protein